jgi:hypothetical protein
MQLGQLAPFQVCEEKLNFLVCSLSASCAAAHIKLVIAAMAKIRIERKVPIYAFEPNAHV